MRRTVLFRFHREYGRLGEYAGFEMPLWYKSPTVEHLAVRNNVGIFDVSHMGRILISGTESGELLKLLLTNNCENLEIMEAQHSFFCNESGGIIDDIMLFRLGEDVFLLVVNAANRWKDLRWIDDHKGDFDVMVEDVTERVPMIAVQGPKSPQTLQKILGLDILNLPRLHASWLRLDEWKLLISRTGYTGEDGFEIYLFEDGGEEDALKLWEAVLDAGRAFGIEPCGLASRDTLRLEAGFCLYGNELNEEVTPIEAGLRFGVKLDGRGFIGEEALRRLLEEGVSRVRVGLRVLGRGIPRKGMSILKGGEEIGLVTSGTFSPLLRVGIAMGYVPPEYSRVGTRVEIEVRRRIVEAEVVKLPFYDERRYGWRRKFEA